MMPPARIAMVLALSATAVLASAAAVAAPAAASVRAAAPVPGYATATFTRVSQWSTGYVGSITVRNDTGATINGWRVEFDLAPGTRITSSHSSVLTRTDDHYTVRNAAWNGRLAPGASATFGWVAAGSATPSNCTLNGADCAGVSADHTAPTRPGQLTVDNSSGSVINWGPSTDDHGPVKYELYINNQLRTTTTETRFVWLQPGQFPPPMFFFFSVRAVDAAGNASAYSSAPQAGTWPRDVVPGPPSALRVDTPAAGLLRLSWSPAPVPPLVSAPPIDGYEVYVDGLSVGQVSDTSIIIPALPAGRHTLGVRTFNAVNNYSPVVELTTGATPDVTPPTRPGPLAFEISNGLAVLWGPSTDTQGPVRYQVYESGQLLATVTGTRYVYSNGATLPPRIYVFAVRAVDAAGNVSPSRYRTLGTVWRGDEPAVAPTALRVDTPAAGLVRLLWTPPPVAPQINVPPTAGYEVYVDGRSVGQTGIPSLTIVAPAAGRHTYAVRSINAVDQLSPPAELTVG